MDDFAYMEQAIALAKEAAAEGEIPVGALVADRETGEILGRGRNRRELDHSPTAHAEILAIEEAAKKRGTWRLSGCTLYVTLEPCPMCAGAMLNARLGTLVYGAREPFSGSAASVLNLFAEGYPAKTAVYGGVLADESAALLKAFFEEKRK
jgi:tRNA(adenine34) deaminase